MRPAVAFAAGLWTGGLMMGAVWFFNHQPLPVTPAHAAPAVPASAGDELLQLRQENARLQAESDRLRETVLTLQQIGSAHRRVAGETAAAAAVATMPPTPLELETQAIRNDPAALDSLARSVEDGQRALLRVWKTPQLSEANRSAAERHLSGLLERLVTELEPATTGEAEVPAVPVE